MTHAPQSDGDFESCVKQSSDRLSEQFDIVLAALDRLAERDATAADSAADFETIRRAAKDIGRAVQLDRRVQHQHHSDRHQNDPAS
ncbi:MAG: hypothetical protein ACFB9N_02500 [Geitlerinemataceae cyanobacterium]